jgi:glutamate-1-semialdehyde 2,1-aminomutase
MNKNQLLFEQAQHYIPGGVNSPVRAFGSVGGIPRFIKRAQGAYIWDENETAYIDYVGSWGPAIVGHAHPEVVSAVQAAAEKGLSFGAPTAAEVEIAQTICQLVPSIEAVRLVSSGTEATMSAIRLARGFTRRDKIIKFEGCYHGHSDSLLVKAGSGLLTFGQPSSSGVPEDFTRHTIVLPYNDTNRLLEAFAQIGDEIACVIVEPFAGNMNLVKPSLDFIKALRETTAHYGALLIYDEVMTGFRVSLSCAQGLHNITPDLTTLGKVIGGGMPLAAFGGRRDIMEHISPLGSVYQAGTLSGNPLSVAAGLATLKLITQPGFFETLTQTTRALVEGLKTIATEYKVDFCADSVGGMFGLYFQSQIPTCFADIQKGNAKLFNRFFHAMLDEGVYFAPSAFEAGFVSAAHNETTIKQTLEKARVVFTRLKA